MSAKVKELEITVIKPDTQHNEKTINPINSIECGLSPVFVKTGGLM